MSNFEFPVFIGRILDHLFASNNNQTTAYTYCLLEGESIVPVHIYLLLYCSSRCSSRDKS